MSRIADARIALVEAFEEVLPGRVQAYPGGPPPVVWLGVALPAERRPEQSRLGTTVNTVRFPVTIVHDGADRAQVAGLDEVTAKLCDAIDNLRGARRISATRITETIDGKTLPALVIEVEVTVNGRSFCAPTVEDAEIPPPIAQPA